MPIEGIPAPEPTPKAEAQTTSDETVKNTGAEASGTGTDTAQKDQAHTEKTFTQADVDRIVQTRLKAAVKAELKKLSSDDDPAKPNVEELTRQLSETKQRAQAIEAREAVRDFISDPVHKLNVAASNVAAIVKLVTPDLEFDDAGRPTTL